MPRAGARCRCFTDQGLPGGTAERQPSGAVAGVADVHRALYRRGVAGASQDVRGVPCRRWSSPSIGVHGSIDAAPQCGVVPIHRLAEAGRQRQAPAPAEDMTAASMSPAGPDSTAVGRSRHPSPTFCNGAFAVKRGFSAAMATTDSFARRQECQSAC